MSDDVPINFLTNSILHRHQFSWVFLVDMWMIIALSIFSLFYFNQLLGLLVTHTVGWYLWYRYGVYLKIQSIEISLLGGRIMFRNITYIGTSQALHIVHGSLSWKYWLADRRRSRLLNAQSVVQRMARQAQRYACKVTRTAQQQTEQARETEDWVAEQVAHQKLPPQRAKEAKQEAIRKRQEAKKMRKSADKETEDHEEAFAQSLGTSNPGNSDPHRDDSTAVGTDEYDLNDLAAEETAPGQSAFKLKLYGVEWFVYNREYAYEALHKPEAPFDELAAQWQQGLSSMELRFAELLPLQIDTHQLGVVLGNEDTESLVVISVPYSGCTLDMAPASNESDRYMVRIDADLQLMDVELRANPDFHASSIQIVTQQKRAKRFLWAKKMATDPEPWFGLRRYAAEEEPTSGGEHDRSAGPSASNDEDETASQRKGGSAKAETKVSGATTEQTYPPDDLRTRLAALPVEYAKVTQVLACDYVKLKLCVDIVGADLDAPPPLYDMQMEINNAKVTYGPHAERQRQTFFSVFFPRRCSSPSTTEGADTTRSFSESFEKSVKGSRKSNGSDDPNSETTTSGSDSRGGRGKVRLHPHATVNVTLLGESALVIPVREHSKDNEFAEAFAKHWKSFGGELQRSYGWLELRAEENSRVDVTVPFLPDADGGFHTTCSLNLVTPYVRTSVNHDIMFRASHLVVDVDQHQPALWNAVNTYTIRQQAADLDFFVLREHSNLVEDAMADFSAGTPVPYELFTPTVYVMTLDIHNLQLFLNVNKGNIINSPTSRSENTFLVFKVPELNIVWDIPREDIASPTSKILTLITAPHVNLDLSAPNWHTLQEFLDTKRLATVECFSIKLEHHMSTLVSDISSHPLRDPTANPSRLVSTQILEVAGSQLVFLAHGFFIDYIMRIRENYFGHAYHFKTTEEFLQKQAETNSTNSGGNLATNNTSGEFTRNTDDTDSQMRIRVDRGVFLFPNRLYSTSSCLSLQFVAMDVECRFTNYYMDLQVEVAPVLGRMLRGLNPGTLHEEARQASFATADLSISSLGIHAHRMFGLPPTEQTYVVRWDFDLGDITTDLGLDFLVSTGDAIHAFSHSLDDDENKPVMAPEELYDITFLGLKVSSIVAVIRPPPPAGYSAPASSTNSSPQAAGQTRLELRTSSITFKANDLANERYSAQRLLDIPYLRLRGYTEKGDIALDASTAIHISGFLQKQHGAEKREKQQDHVALNDAMFHRAPFFLDNRHKSQPPFRRRPQPDDFQVCIPLPCFPPPLTQESLAPHVIADGLFNGTSSYTSAESVMDSEESRNGSSGGDAYDEQRAQSGQPTSSGTGAASSSEGEQNTNPFTDTEDGSKNHRNNHQATPPGNSNSGTEPDIFPFSSDNTKNEREWLRTRRAWFGLRPRAWRANAPTLETDPEAENPSLVIQIMPVRVRMTPGILGLATAFESNKGVDFEAQLDALQVRILVELLRSKLTIEVLRVHLVVPTITVDLSERIGSAHSVHLQLDYVDMMYSSNGKQIRGAHADFDSLLVSVRQGNAADFAQISAASLVLSKLDVWWQQTSKKDSTGSVELSGIDVSFAADKIDWVIHYLSQLIMAIPTSASRRATGHATPSKHKLLMSTFYALTMAGEQMGVEQDSYVLSRPSGAVQSRDHVRSKISWRVVMRLRYLLHRIPPSERIALQSAIAENRFELPADAKSQLLDVYRHWRSWEQSRDLAETEIFQLVFDDLSFQEYVLSLSTRVEILVESMVARVVYADGHDHFVGTTGLNMNLSSTKQNETQVLSLNFSCARIRALGSMDLIMVAATIMVALGREAETYSKLRSHSRHKNSVRSVKIEDGKNGILSDSTSQAQYSETSKTPDNKPETKQTALQANISVFLLDLILEFTFDTITVETQNHQVQFTAAVELMDSGGVQSLFHTGTLVSANGAFRVLEPQRADVIDALVSGVHVGFASRGVGFDHNSWVTVDIASASLVTHRKVEELMHMLIKFLETELPIIKEAHEKLEQCAPRKKKSISSAQSLLSSASSVNSASGDTDDKAITGGRFLNFNVHTLKLRALLVDNFKLMWIGRELVFKLRAATALSAPVVVASMDVQRSSTGIHFGDGSAAVVNLQLENIRTVMQYEKNRVSMFNKVSSLNVETMSLIWLLEYAQRHRMDVQFSRIKKSIDAVVELLSVADGADTESAVTSTTGTTTRGDGCNLKLKMVNSAAHISVKLPLDKSPLNLRVDGARLFFSQFDQNSEDALEIRGGIDDCVLELATLRRPPRTLVHLKFVVSTQLTEENLLVNVESEYIRFAFDPEAVGAIYLAVQKLENYAVIFNKPANDARTSNADQEANGAEEYAPTPIASSASTTSQKPKQQCSFNDWQKLRLRMLLNRLTITWYTNSKSAEGVVLGYDRLGVSVSRLAARVELADAYVTPVGTSRIPLKDRPNTIHLPLLEAKAFITTPTSGKQLISTKITGKTVALMITPSVGPWALALVDSFTDTSKTLNKLAMNRTRLSNQNQQQSHQQPTNKCKLKVPFDLKITAGFDRSVLRLFDEGARKRDPALELLSPQVDVNIEFIDTRLLLRIDASQTSNTMYPKALSEMRALSALLTAALKQRASRIARNVSPPNSPTYPSTGFMPYLPGNDRPGTGEPTSNVPTRDRPTKNSPAKDDATTDEHYTDQFSSLDNLELDVQVHFGSQELHLSSEPYSKVGALLSTDGVDVLFTSPRGSHKEKSYFTLYSLVKRTRISLQHMYSREISAMVEVSRFCGVGLYRNDEPFKLAMDISSLKLHLDLARLHDTRIFFDVWTLYTTTATPDPPQSKFPRPRGRSTNSRLTTTLLGPSLFANDNKDDSVFSSELSPTASISSGHSTGTTETHASHDSNSSSNENLLIDRYKNAVSQLPFMYVINFSIHTIECRVGMGASIGDAKVEMGRLWLALMKTSTFDQMLNIGIHSVAAHFEGRLGGTICIDGILAKMAIRISERRSYPLTHAKIRLDKIGFYLGLDFHPFVAGDTTGLAVVLTTQDKADVTDDRVHVAITSDSVSVVITALFVVHVHDVMVLFKRLQSQISLAPIFMSAEAAQETATRSSERRKLRQKRILEHMSSNTGMRVLIDLRFGELLMHIFPTDFSDSVALKLFANHVETHLDRHNLEDMFIVGVDLALDECMVSLANIRHGGYNKPLAELDYVKFLKFLQKSSTGGIIVSTPEITLLMDTWEYKNRPHEVQYTFSNQVRGSIDFGWNLGSVNFIKEMLNAHKEAWSARQDFFEASGKGPDEGNPSAKVLREAAANIERSASLKQTGALSPRRTHRRTFSAASFESITSDSTVSSTPSSPSTPSASSSTSSTGALYFMGTKYIAKSTPMIRIPQVRDLGDATPPIEWLGVNRERIPILIHHFYTKKATMAADEIEKLVLLIIGHLD